MAANDHTMNLFATCSRIANEFIDQSVSQGLTTQATFLNLDQFGQIPELPDNDVIGWFGFNLVLNNPLLLNVTFFISTFNDYNLYRHHKILNLMAKQLCPSISYEIYDWETNPVSKVGSMMIMEPTIIREIPRAQTRAVQSILVSFGTTLTYSN